MPELYYMMWRIRMPIFHSFGMFYIDYLTVDVAFCEGPIYTDIWRTKSRPEFMMILKGILEEQNECQLRLGNFRGFLQKIYKVR